ncbi:MAG: TMEM175 family protein [Pseudonocardiaceae bacterium]
MATAEGDYTGSTRGNVEDNSLGRLLTLSDGVFAIAMTLLAVDLRVPELPDPVTNTALLDELGRELPSILTFLLSFLRRRDYWFSHHRLMRSVTTTHPRLLRHTMPLLLVVAAMPFPTSLLGRYASVPIALALYGVVNVLAVLWLRHDDRWRCAGAPSGGCSRHTISPCQQQPPPARLRAALQRHVAAENASAKHTITATSRQLRRSVGASCRRSDRGISPNPPTTR